MPPIFEQWDYQKATEALNKRQKPGDKESLAYVVEKDNWQDGSGWSGPQITGGSSLTNTLKEGINRDFTPTGDIPSVVRRHRRGVVGRESGWVCEGGTDERIKEAYDLLLRWWNFHKGLRVFRTAVSYYAAVGRGPLRLYLPPGRVKDISFNGQVRRGFPAMDFREAVKTIFLLAPKPTEATVVTDTESMMSAGVYTYEDREGKSAVGICYVNDAGKTVVRTLKPGASLSEQASASAGKGLIERASDYLRGGESGDKPKGFEYDLNGNLFLFELDGEALITEQVRRQQKLVDKALTMLSHNMDEAGFREEVYLNAKPPGKMIKVTDPDTGQEVEVFKEATDPYGAPEMRKGPSSTRFIEGLSWTEKDEATGKSVLRLATPSRVVTDPVPVTTYKETAEVAQRNILKDCDQLHVQIAGDADSSGESRKQARDDYTKSLEETKSEVDYVGSALMETVLRLAALLANKPGYFDGITVSFNARIDPGPLGEGDRRMNIEEMKEGIKSVEDAMQFAGISDPDAMKEKIKEEAKEKVKAGVTPPPAPPLNQPDEGRELPVN